MSPLHTNITISERELILVCKRHTPNAREILKKQPPVSLGGYHRVGLRLPLTGHEKGGHALELLYFSKFYDVTFLYILS